MTVPRFVIDQCTKLVRWLQAGIYVLLRLFLGQGQQSCGLLFFFNDTATTEIYTLSLHDALPIFLRVRRESRAQFALGGRVVPEGSESFAEHADRKSTRLNSSHSQISYAVFCLKKKIDC